jgi:hypothetical protein
MLSSSRSRGGMGKGTHRSSSSRVRVNHHNSRGPNSISRGRVYLNSSKDIYSSNSRGMGSNNNPRAVCMEML